MKKRILSIILAALMVIGSVGTFAIGTAAAGEFTLSVDVEKIDNDKVHVILNMENNPGCSGLDVTISFDNTVIRPVSYDTIWNESAQRDVMDTCLFGGLIQTNVGAPGVDMATLSSVTFVAVGTDAPEGTEVYVTSSGKLIGFTFDILDPDKYTELTIDAEIIDKNQDEMTFVADDSQVGLRSLEGLTMDNKTVEYDGTAHSLEVNGLDGEMSVAYTNNNKINAGEYEVTAVVTKDGYFPKTLTATLTITVADAVITGVQLWPVTQEQLDAGEVPAIKSLENAQVELKTGTRGWDLVKINPAVVKDGAVYKLTGVSAPTTNVNLDTTITFTTVAADKLVDAIIAAADIDTDMPVDPRVSRILPPDVVLPYGYELDLVANAVVAEDGSFEKTEEEQIVPVTYNVVDASGTVVGSVVVTYTIPRQAKGSDLAMLLLYYHKLMEEKNKGSETVNPSTPVVNSITLKADAANIKYLEGRGDKFEPTESATRYEVIKAIANLFDIKTTNAPLALADVADEYKELVDLCTAAGIIKGYEDKTFRGDDSITRAEIATMICNVMNLDVASAKDAGFKDVSGWATNYVNACANAGYVQGKGDGEFAPSENITRAELATLFNNITGAKAGTSCSYDDVDADAWYFGYVAAAAK